MTQPDPRRAVEGGGERRMPIRDEPTDYEAAIQAGAEGLLSFLRTVEDKKATMAEMSKAVIDAAIASGELVERQRLVDCMDENERLARLVEWGEANAHEACSQEVDRLADDKSFWEDQFKQASAEMERLRDENEQLRERHEGCKQLLADHNRYRDENEKLKRAVGELDEERQHLHDAWQDDNFNLNQEISRLALENERLRDAIRAHQHTIGLMRPLPPTYAAVNEKLYQDALGETEEDPDEDRMGFEAYQRAKDEEGSK